MPNRDMELARALYPKAADVVAEVLGADTQTTYAYGVAASDSTDGNVQVVVDGETAGVDGAIDVPTSNAINEGDTVLVSISGNVPVEAVAKGSGDITRAMASEAKTIAEEAQEVAEATGQHFWDDDNGAHVSTDALNPTGASNSLWNSDGLLIRKAANILVSITRSAIAFFDGLGNSDANTVAQFGSDGARVGYEADAHVSLDGNSLDVKDGTAVLSTFDANGARIGANSQQAVIDFCNGLGEVRNFNGAMSVNGSDGVRLWTSGEDTTLDKSAKGGIETQYAFGSGALAQTTVQASLDNVAETDPNALSASVVAYANYDSQNGYSTEIGLDAQNVRATGEIIDGHGNYLSAKIEPYKAGDSFDFEWDGAGFCTGGAKQVAFSLPLCKPLADGVNAEVTFPNSSHGFINRGWNNYTHGSAAGSPVKPSSHYITLSEGYIRVRATFSASTNATNNAPIGIYVSGRVTFS